MSVWERERERESQSSSIKCLPQLARATLKMTERALWCSFSLAFLDQHSKEQHPPPTNTMCTIFHFVLQLPRTRRRHMTVLTATYFQQLECDLLGALLNHSLHQVKNLPLTGWKKGVGRSRYSTRTRRRSHTNLHEHQQYTAIINDHTHTPEQVAVKSGESASHVGKPGKLPLLWQVWSPW